MPSTQPADPPSVTTTIPSYHGYHTILRRCGLAPAHGLRMRTRSDPNANRGGGDDDADEMTGGGSDNADNPNLDLECGKGIRTADGPFETEQCNGSCECEDNCCIQFHVARFCAPRGDNGMSSFGGGFSMRCI